MNVKLIFQFILSVSLCYTIMNSELTSHELKRLDYYNSIFADALNPTNVALGHDDKGLVLIPRKDLNQEILFAIKDEYVLSSCTFFPLKERILEAIKFFQLTHERFKIVPEEILLLTYQLLYYRHGDQREARKYYKEKNNFEYESSFYSFFPNNKIRSYIDYIFGTVTLNSFSYSESTINLLKFLGWKLDYHFIAIEAFNSVRNYIKTLEEDEQKILRTFTENISSFKKILGFLAKSTINVPIEQFANIYSESVKREFVDYNKLLLESGLTESTHCALNSPFLDLFRNRENDQVEDDKVNLQLNIINSMIGFNCDKIIPANNPVKISIFNQNELEHSLLNFGSFYQELIEDSVTETVTFLEKKYFSTKKAKFCEKISCLLNIPMILNSEKNGENFALFLSKKSLDYPFLNILKLMFFEDKVLSDKHIHNFQTYKRFSYGLEIRVATRYLNVLKEIDEKTGETLYLIEDLSKINRLSEKKENSIYLYSFEVNKAILKISLHKKKTLLKHQELLNKELEDIVRTDLAKIKTQFLENL